MSERDELIKIFENSDQLGCGCCADSREVSTGPEDWEVDYVPRVEALADDILAAGFRKPRVVETAAELDALSDETVIRDADGDVAEKWIGQWQLWHVANSVGSAYFSLPATVLHEGAK